jgi:hypothetical protein
MFFSSLKSEKFFVLNWNDLDSKLETDILKKLGLLELLGNGDNKDVGSEIHQTSQNSNSNHNNAHFEGDIDQGR